MSIIRFEQASKQLNEADKFQDCLEKYQIICREFQKAPILQMAAWDIWAELLDLTTYWSDKDYSQMLLDRTNKAISDFEELQKDNLLEDTKKIIITAIERANNKKES